MANRTVIVNSRKYDGRIRRTWMCELVEETDEMIVLVGEFDRDISHPGLGDLRRGTISYEYYWLKRWYNVFRFHEPEGVFRNFYCNIAMPPVWTGAELDYADLDIDVLVRPDGTIEIQDRDDFAENTVKYSYPDDVIEKVEQTLTELTQAIERCDFPFDSIENRNI